MQPDHDKHNNFDFLRLGAALAVLVSHQFALTGQPEPMLQSVSPGALGVLVFFAISGYLVAGSWERDPHLLRFVARRLLRIWPGLAVATLLLTLAWGPLVSALDAKAYFASPMTWSYLRLLGLWEFRFELPGVFEGNPSAHIANGSLWTIPVEVFCYGAFALMGVFGMITRRWLPLVILALAAYWVVYLWSLEDGWLFLKVRMGLTFLVGAFLWSAKNWWQPRRHWLAAVVVILAGVLWNTGQNEAALLLGVPFIAVSIGSLATPGLRRAGRFGDISYGMYVYAFPVQQTVIWLTGNSFGVIPGAITSIVVTALFAWLSWHGLEKPALRWKETLRGLGR